MEAQGQATSFSERLYRSLLVAYPEEFRRQYSEQLVQAFGDLRREELEQRGRIGLLVLWLRTLSDLLMSVLLERSVFPVSSLSLVRLGGSALVLGGVVQLVSWWLFFAGVRFVGWSPGEFWANVFSFLPHGPVVIDFATGLLAAGLVALGVSLIWEATRVTRWAKALTAAGISLAVLSVIASILQIVVGVVIGAYFVIGPWSDLLPSSGAIVPSGSLQAVLLNVGNLLEYWGLALASVTIGGALMFTRSIRRWWILLPVNGILAIPQTTSLLTFVIWWLSYDGSNSVAGIPSAVSIVPHAIVASGWIAIGLVLVSRRSKRLEEPARTL